MARTFEEFPVIAEMLQRAIKIRHRYRRAVEMNRPGAAARAELDGLRLYHQIEVAKQITDGFFNAMRLSRAISQAVIRQAQSTRMSEPTGQHQGHQVHLISGPKPMLRKSYAMELWTDRYVLEEGI